MSLGRDAEPRRPPNRKKRRQPVVHQCPSEGPCRLASQASETPSFPRKNPRPLFRTGFLKTLPRPQSRPQRKEKMKRRYLPPPKCATRSEPDARGMAAPRPGVDANQEYRRNGIELNPKGNGLSSRPAVRSSTQDTRDGNSFRQAIFRRTFEWENSSNCGQATQLGTKFIRKFVEFFPSARGRNPGRRTP